MAVMLRMRSAFGTPRQVQNSTNLADSGMPGARHARRYQTAIFGMATYDPRNAGAIELSLIFPRN